MAQTVLQRADPRTAALTDTSTSDVMRRPANADWPP